jgi:hypothetical protein
LDPANDGAEVVIAEDSLSEHSWIGRSELTQCRSYLDALLADKMTSNADLKGMLNRNTGRAWGVEFDFGVNANAARRFLEALQRALVRKLS